MSQKETLIGYLKEQWLSNYEMQQLVHSSSADRTARTIRENPPEGFVMVQRPKDVPEGYNRCLEFKLEPVND